MRKPLTDVLDLGALADSLDTCARQITSIAETLRSIQAEEEKNIKQGASRDRGALIPWQPLPVISDKLIYDPISPEALMQRIAPHKHPL